MGPHSYSEAEPGTPFPVALPPPPLSWSTIIPCFRHAQMSLLSFWPYLAWGFLSASLLGTIVLSPVISKQHL